MRKKKYREKRDSGVKKWRSLNTSHTDVERSYLNDTTVNIVWLSFLVFIFSSGGLLVYRAYVHYHRFCHVDTCPLEYTFCEQEPYRPVCQCFSQFIKNETTGLCEDRNECTESTHDCGGSTVCANNFGGFSCHCKSGYLDKLGNGQECNDVDECYHGVNCGDFSSCLNTEGLGVENKLLN